MVSEVVRRIIGSPLADIVRPEWQVRLDAAWLRAAGLDDGAVAPLVDVGLPRIPALYFTPNAGSSQAELQPTASHRLELGSGARHKLVVDTEDGSVWAYQDGLPDTDCLFVNSSPGLAVDCLWRYAALQEWISASPVTDETYEALDALLSAFTDRDEAVQRAAPMSFWPSLLDAE